MRFFVILCLALGYVEAAAPAAVASADSVVAPDVAPPAAADASPAACSIRQDFPNYFARMSPDEAKGSINLSIRLILEHLQVPYEEGDQIRYDGFFRKIQEIVTAQVSGATAYISGGMVRSLLGYIYKRKHNDAVEEQSTDEDEALETSTKPLTTLKTLGIGSDFDVLIEFPENTTDAIKAQTIQALKTFINSAQNHFGLTNDQSELKRAMVPDADVGEYDVQMYGSFDKKGAVQQGGATLDWLAFSLREGVIKLPKDHPGIMDDFIQGHLHYIANAQATDKQTMRGLRILLEIPFLTFDPASAQVMAAELRRLIDKGTLSDGALEQLKKMTRNARFGGAGNRFAGGNCMPDGEITALVQELAERVNREELPQNQRLGRNTLVHEFVGRRSVRNRSQAQNAPTFMPYVEFIAKYTDNGTLYHGTPDVVNFLSMIRNGLVVSSATQGNGAFGYGVYSTKDYATAEVYTKNTGIVIPLTVRDSARIVDMAIPENRAHYKAWLAGKGLKEKRFGDSFKGYADEFGIDIIVNEHVLIQNAKAIRLEKSLKSIVEADRALVRVKVKAGRGVTIGKVLRTFSATEGFGKIYPPSEDDLRMVAGVSRDMEKVSFSDIYDSLDCDISNLHILVSNDDLSLSLKKFVGSGVIKKLSIESLVDLPLDLDLRHLYGKIDQLKLLIDAGVLKKVSINELIDLPVDLDLSQINELKLLIDAGVLERPLSFENLILFIEGGFVFTRGITESLLALHRVGAMGTLKKWWFLPKLHFDKIKPVVVENLVYLFSKGVINQLDDDFFLNFLKDLPLDLSNVINQADKLKKLVEDKIIQKLGARDLAMVPPTANWEQSIAYQVKALNLSYPLFRDFRIFYDLLKLGIPKEQLTRSSSAKIYPSKAVELLSDFKGVINEGDLAAELYVETNSFANSIEYSKAVILDNLLTYPTTLREYVELLRMLAPLTAAQIAELKALRKPPEMGNMRWLGVAIERLSNSDPN